MEEQDDTMTLDQVRDVATRYLIAVACRKKYMQNLADTLSPEDAKAEEKAIRDIEEEFESVLEKLDKLDLLKELETNSDLLRFEETREMIKVVLKESPYEKLREAVLKNCSNLRHRLDSASKAGAQKILEGYPFGRAGQLMDASASRNDFISAYICLTRMFLQAHEDLLDRLASTILLLRLVKK
ncbi:MAG: hypothetical protein HYT98_00490 [Candidatus Sungbacteria bacterium]|nr:hypothetical protein [Candidatus Sungbacteria bacterium]